MRPTPASTSTSLPDMDMTRSHSRTLAGALVALALLSAAPAYAQTPQGTPPAAPPSGDMRHHGPMMGHRMMNAPSVDERVQRMSGELNLTAEQTARVKALLTAEQRSADSTRAVRAVQMEAERKAMETRHDAHEKALLAILTPEQKTKREALMKQQQGPDGRGHGGERRGGRDEQRKR
jgi:periplasmic protein CpxP/Spy